MDVKRIKVAAGCPLEILKLKYANRDTCNYANVQVVLTPKGYDYKAYDGIKKTKSQIAISLNGTAELTFEQFEQMVELIKHRYKELTTTEDTKCQTIKAPYWANSK